MRSALSILCYKPGSDRTFRPKFRILPKIPAPGETFEKAVVLSVTRLEPVAVPNPVCTWDYDYFIVRERCPSGVQKSTYVTVRIDYRDLFDAWFPSGFPAYHTQ